MILIQKPFMGATQNSYTSEDYKCVHIYSTYVKILPDWDSMSHFLGVFPNPWLPRSCGLSPMWLA